MLTLEVKFEPFINRVIGKVADYRSVNHATVLEPLCMEQDEFSEKELALVN